MNIMFADLHLHGNFIKIMISKHFYVVGMADLANWHIYTRGLNCKIYHHSKMYVVIHLG